MEKKIASLIGEIEALLAPLYPAMTRQQYAWWILQALTKATKADLITKDTLTLTDKQQEQLKQWLDAMINEHKPLQYVLGTVPFGNISLVVRPPVLIPRQETEEWTYALIEKLQHLKQQELTILDVCSGSGCIALAIAHALPKARVYATDILSPAIELAQENARLNNITNVTFIQTDLFDALDTSTLFDLIVANPPYVSFDEWQELDNSVTTWEDPQSIVAADSGLALINEILEQAPDYLKYNKELELKKIPQLTMEIGFTQGAAVADLMKTAGFIDVTVHKDLEKKDRYVTGRVPHEADASVSP